MLWESWSRMGFGKIPFVNDPALRQLPGSIPTVDHQTPCMHRGSFLFAKLLPNGQNSKQETRNSLQDLEQGLIDNDIICSRADPSSGDPSPSGSPWGVLVSCCWGYARILHFPRSPKHPTLMLATTVVMMASNVSDRQKTRSRTSVRIFTEHSTA
jgi:hypothetical protein